MTSQLGEGDVVGCLVGGGDEVGYGFCLGEVKFAIEVGALCELSRVCEATTVLYQEFQDFVEYVSGTVAGYFCRVFACVGVGSTENRDQHLVDVGNVAIMDGVGLGCSQVLGEYTGKNLKGLLS